MLRAATRGSSLALNQTRQVASLLDEPVEEVVVQTTGDRRQDVPIWDIGGRGVFVKEVQAAVLEGRADFAVHSAKDLPPRPAPGLELVAVPERGDARDALVGSTLEELPPGALVATGSVRRRAQMVSLRPDLTFASLRGNVDTRLEKAPRYSAVMMAAVALERLDRQAAVAQHLDPRLVLPQVGQGALAIECREDDDRTMEALTGLDHRPSRRAVDAERSFLDRLGGGCDLPVAGHASGGDDGSLHLEGLLASLDGRIVLRLGADGDDPVELGRTLAADLLDEGGTWLLEGMSRA